MKNPRLHVGNTTYFCISAVVAVVGTAIYLHYRDLTWFHLAAFLTMLTLTLMSISCGYHRLYSHRSYDAARWLKFFYLVFGAAAYEQACAKWSAEHRLHHRFVDTDADPYNIKRGFLWAHIGWILHEDRERVPYPKDLTDDPLVVWQEKYWLPIGIVAGFGLPALVGLFIGDFWGGLLFGGVVRVVIGQHLTFMINSLAHTIGKQPFSDENTARDSWLTAVFTFGEGYHNFHHFMPGDYRNGVRFVHWDPPKWFIYVMDRMGQAWDLKRTPEEIQVRARAEMDRKRAATLPLTVRELLDARFHKLMERISELGDSRRAWMAAAKATASDRMNEEVALLRKKFKECRANFRTDYKNWKMSIRRVTLSGA